MPCYEPRSQRSAFEDNISFPTPRRRPENKDPKLEAIICALINELKRRGIDNEVIASASRSGLVDIMSFWSDHNKTDRARIAKDLHRYSKDEQDIIRDILSKTK